MVVQIRYHSRTQNNKKDIHADVLFVILMCAEAGFFFLRPSGYARRERVRRKTSETEPSKECVELISDAPRTRVLAKRDWLSGTYAWERSESQCIEATGDDYATLEDD